MKIHLFIVLFTKEGDLFADFLGLVDFVLKKAEPSGNRADFIQQICFANRKFLWITDSILKMN